jgi:hypothetical protein
MRLSVLSVIAIVGLFPGLAGAQDNQDSQPVRLAAVALPSGARADWRDWDAFLSNAVKTLVQSFTPEQREQIADIFLDARYQLVQALSSGSADPVPQLLADSWAALSPTLKQIIPSLPQQTAGQVSAFVTAMDGVSSLGGLGQQLGLGISADALREAARLLGTTTVDPLTYTLDVDGGLRDLFGFSAALPAIRTSPLFEQGSFRPPPVRRASVPWRSFFGPRAAHAAQADYSKLNEWFPDDGEWENYLELVRDLLADTHKKMLQKSNLAAEHHSLYKGIMLATAWQESCWRQFVKKGKKLAPLSSVTGDLGLMQVNRHVWRGLYDVKGLSSDIEYNGYAGAEILMRYLSRYALPKNEHKQPGGHLARATYAAYNGGPSQLTRYRAEKQNTQLKRIDEDFWQKYQAVAAGRELAVKSCYGL